MSDFILSSLPKRMGFPAVPHGFRSSFRDWAAERTVTIPERWPRWHWPTTWALPLSGLIGAGTCSNGGGQ